MGLSLFGGSRRRGAPPAIESALQQRFGSYFPSLFAYARSWVNDDTAAREIVAEAFTGAFVRRPDLPDEEFRLFLFGLARRLCRSAASRGARPNDPLSPREREVLSLRFDAQLSRSDIGCLLKVKEDAVTSTLVRGLKKLRANTSPAAVAAYLHLT